VNFNANNANVVNRFVVFYKLRML